MPNDYVFIFVILSRIKDLMFLAHEILRLCLITTYAVVLGGSEESDLSTRILSSRMIICAGMVATLFIRVN
ncbi:MAG: hypothetical protein HYV59_06340 [Planctomycetes bacterium]|nr:hypothetical protein [Planctomycetota bacterium]